MRVSERAAKTRPAWFRKPINIWWFAFSILSFGILVPGFISYLRNLKRKKYISGLNLISLCLILALKDPTLGVLGLFAAFLLSLVLRKKDVLDQSATETTYSHFQETLISDEEVSQGSAGLIEAVALESVPVESETKFLKSETEPILELSEEEVVDISEINNSDQIYDPSFQPVHKMSFFQWLNYMLKIRPQVKLTRESFLYQLELTERMKVAKAEFEQAVEAFNLDSLGHEHDVNLFEVLGCGLIEVRKGARVTHRESTYSGSYGGGSVRVGAFSLGGGRSGGSSSSTSISYPAPDELTLIDEGKFIISSLKVSLVGSMFTKTTEFKKLVDYQTNGSQILFAPKTGSKVWIAQFPRLADTWIVGSLLDAAYQSPEKRLDVKGTTDYGTIKDAVESNFRRAIAEVNLAISDSDAEIKIFREVLSEYARRYPSQVKPLEE